MIGLVLQGGGARGAYQVGALSAINEILNKNEKEKIPFNSISGISVGAINASMLAMHSQDFSLSILELKKAWLSLTHEKVYSMGKLGIVSSWLNMFGKGENNKYLFNNIPLEKFLDTVLDFDKIHLNAQKNKVNLNLHSYCYTIGKNIVFTNCYDDNSLKNICKTKIDTNHIVASSALPFVFPEKIINKKIYGDGGLKLEYPSVPLINQGCKKILGISLDTESQSHVSEHLFSSIFPDSITSDFNKIKEKNDKVTWVPFQAEKYNKIETLLLRPSAEHYEIKESFLDSLPKSLQYTKKILGLNHNEKAFYLNYILFNSDYAEYLINHGYKDTVARKDEIIEFFK